MDPAPGTRQPVINVPRFFILFSYISFLFIFLQPLSFPAQMAKLVDALVSGTSVSNDVQVRVLFWAQEWRSSIRAQRLNGRKRNGSF
jgi:hypothetical protein